MTRNYRRERGSETQNTAAAWFRGNGWPACQATGAGRQGRDLTGLPGLDIEVKGRRDLNLIGWLRQAVTRAGTSLPAVLHRPDGYGPAKIADWPVTVRLADFTRLLRAAGYGATKGAPSPSAQLHPAENMALTVARARLERGDSPEPNTTGMLIMALDRLTGEKDWTAE